MDWESGWIPLPGENSGSEGGIPGVEDGAAPRLDAILPLDPETEAVTNFAFRIYLASMLDMVGRCEQTLTVLHFGIDESPALRFLGSVGGPMIARAVARCLRQESRVYDVVGCAEELGAQGTPTFVIACPLMDEEQAFALAMRLQAAMVTQATGTERPWLTVSVGIATLSIDASEPDTLLARAASAWHRARRTGRGDIWRHSDTLKRIRDSHDSEGTDPSS